MNYETQRLAFGDRLAALRIGADLKQKELAAALGWDPSKVSKLEHGKQLPSDRDLTDWLQATHAGDHLGSMRDRLRRLRIAHGAWRRQVGGGHSGRQAQDAREESAASVIRAVDIMVVPGLLQIADYARAVFLTQADLLDTSADDVDEAVRARLQRSAVLYEPDRTVEILIAESALSTAVCPPRVMVAQLDRLAAVVGLPGVRFGVLPSYQQLPHLVPTGFWIVDHEVFVEHPAGELRIDDEDQVATYNKLADRLWTAALEDDGASRIITENRRRWADVSAD